LVSVVSSDENATEVHPRPFLDLVSSGRGGSRGSGPQYRASSMSPSFHRPVKPEMPSGYVNLALPFNVLLQRGGGRDGAEVRVEGWEVSAKEEANAQMFLFAGEHVPLKKVALDGAPVLKREEALAMPPAVYVGTSVETLAGSSKLLDMPL